MQNAAEFKQLVHEAIEENQTIKELKADVKELKTGLQETNRRLDAFMIRTEARFDRLETKFTHLEGRFDRLEVRVDRLEEGFVQLNEKVAYLGVMFEDFQKDIKIILEALVPARQRVVQIDQMEEKVEDHDHRIHAVEITVQDHLADHHES